VSTATSAEVGIAITVVMVVSGCLITEVTDEVNEEMVE